MVGRGSVTVTWAASLGPALLACRVKVASVPAVTGVGVSRVLVKATAV